MKKRRLTNKNKKLIAILCGVAVLFAAIALIVHHTTRITNDSYANCSIGDVNGDGFINSLDSLLIIQSTSDDNLLFDNQKRLADVNCDGIVNSADVLILVRYTIGEIDHIPYVDGDEANSANKNNSKRVELTTDKTLTNVQIINEWNNDDGTHSYQFSVSVKNICKDDIGGWNTKISLSSPVELSKSWDCKCKANSDEIIVRSSSIPAESTATCGFIITAPEGLKIKQIQTED